MRAIRKSTHSDLTDPGDFSFYADFDNSNVGMIIKCPGCGEDSCLPFSSKPEHLVSPSWKWDGDLEQPTLTPSVHHREGCGWHGYLTKGEWKSV